MARKPLSNTPKTDTPLRIRLTDAERQTINDAADRAGQPASTWLRDLALKTAAEGRPAGKRRKHAAAA